jgi:Flp pilus assembly protein CpaB
LSTRFRIGILVLLVGLGIAALGFYVFTILLRQTLAPLPQPTERPPLTERVTSLTHDIPLGSILKSEDVRMLDVPVELVPSGALRSAEEAIGRITKVDLMAGELLMSNNLADPTNISHDIAFIVDDSMVVMAFPANDLMSTINILQRGDLVDIFVSVPHTVPVAQEGEGVVVAEGEEQQTISELFTYDALQRVEITAMIVDRW